MITLILGCLSGQFKIKTLFYILAWGAANKIDLYNHLQQQLIL